jgi:hypothetical protein
VIYRIITEFRIVRWVVSEVREDLVMIGAGHCFAEVMFARGLHAPLIQNPRARFYFTERGWDRVGRFVAREARRKGFLIRVIRRKNPPTSQIVYRDDFQVALLYPKIKKQNR